MDPIVLHRLLEISQEASDPSDPSDPQVGTGIKVEAETWLQPAAIPTSNLRMARFGLRPHRWCSTIDGSSWVFTPDS